MSTKRGKYKKHKFHGAPERFEIVAGFVFETFGRNIKYIADIAGGRGMLSRILNKKYNYVAEVVDPRGYTLKGVLSRKEEYSLDLASYYDLVIGLHPDEATRPVVESALVTNTLIIPCCNFWDQNRKLGRNALVDEISRFYESRGIAYKVVQFDFNSPKNVGLVTFV